MLGDGVRDRDGVETRDERGGVSVVIPRKLRGMVNVAERLGVYELVTIYTISSCRQGFGSWRREGLWITWGIS